MLGSELNEKSILDIYQKAKRTLADKFYLICYVAGEKFFCAPDGDATLNKEQAAVFDMPAKAAAKIENFLQDVYEYVTVKSRDKLLQGTAIVPVEQLKESTLDEDFGMGVGAPVGADQGIPYGGDGKAVVPCYMGMTSRFGSVGNKATGFGGILWPKRKKKKRRKVSYYPNFVRESVEDDSITPENLAAFLEDLGITDDIYAVQETDDNVIVVSLNANPVTTSYVDDVNNLFSVISISDYNSQDVIIITIDRLTQTASIRIADEEVVTGMACANMTDFEAVWQELNNLTEA